MEDYGVFFVKNNPNKIRKNEITSVFGVRNRPYFPGPKNRHFRPFFRPVFSAYFQGLIFGRFFGGPENRPFFRTTHF